MRALTQTTMASLLCLGLVAGCRHAPPPVDGSVRPGGALPALALRRVALATPHAVDELSQSWAADRGAAEAAAGLLRLADMLDAKLLARDAGARRLALEAVVRTVHAGALSERFDQVRAVVDRLYRAAPEAAETRFALAYLRWILLEPTADGLRPRAGTGDILADLHLQLSALAREAPQFDGPDPYDAAWIRRTRDEVAALAQSPSPAGL